MLMVVGQVRIIEREMINLKLYYVKYDRQESFYELSVFTIYGKNSSIQFLGQNFQEQNVQIGISDGKVYASDSYIRN